MPYTKIINVKLESQYLHCDFFSCGTKTHGRKRVFHRCYTGWSQDNGIALFPTTRIIFVQVYFNDIPDKNKFFQGC